MRNRSLTSLLAAVALLVAACGGSGHKPVAAGPPPPVGKGACLTARSAALAILARALHGSGPMSTRLRDAERRAAGALRSAAHQISELDAAAGSQKRSLAPALAGGARRLSYLAGRVKGTLPAHALADYSAAGQMIYDACA